MLGWKELLIVLAIVLLVFGTKRLASVGGDLGKAIQSFKKGMRDSNASDAPPAKLDAPPAEGSGSANSADRERQDR